MPPAQAADPRLSQPKRDQLGHKYVFHRILQDRRTDLCHQTSCVRSPHRVYCIYSA